MTDTSSRKRQPRGTTTGGQFAAEARGESPVSLSGAPTPRSHDDIVSQYAQLLPALHVIGKESGAVQRARDNIEELSYLADGQVPREYIGELLVQNHSAERGCGPFGAREPVSKSVADSIAAAYSSGMPVSWPTEISQQYGLQWGSSAMTMWSNGMTSERLAQLHEHGLASSPDMARVYQETTDLAQCALWNDRIALESQGFRNYIAENLGHVGIAYYVSQGVQYSDLQLAHQYGLPARNALDGITRPDGSVERGPLALRELAEWKHVSRLPDSMAHDGIKVGIPAKIARGYGSGFTPQQMKILAEAHVPGWVAQSSRKADPTASVQDIASAHNKRTDQIKP